MKKMFYALMALMVLTSCGDKKNNNGTNPLTGEKTENGTEAESKVEFNDQPLLAISEYESPDWYVPVGYTPSSSNENLDYENFTEEQWKELTERNEKETAAYYELLKKNMERYTVLRNLEGDKKVSFVAANFDKGQESTIAMGWQGAERDEHMKYLRYRNESGVNENGWDMAILVTEEYAKTHKPLKVEGVETTYDEDGEEQVVPLPPYQVEELEKITGKKL